MDFYSFWRRFWLQRPVKFFRPPACGGAIFHLGPISFHSQVRFMANVTFSSSSLYAHWIDANIGHMPNPYLIQAKFNSKPPPQQARIFEQPCRILELLSAFWDRISLDFKNIRKKLRRTWTILGIWLVTGTTFLTSPPTPMISKLRWSPEKNIAHNYFWQKFSLFGQANYTLFSDDIKTCFFMFERFNCSKGSNPINRHQSNVMFWEKKVVTRYLRLNKKWQQNLRTDPPRLFA